MAMSPKEEFELKHELGQILSQLQKKHPELNTIDPLKLLDNVMGVLKLMPGMSPAQLKDKGKELEDTFLITAKVMKLQGADLDPKLLKQALGMALSVIMNHKELGPNRSKEIANNAVQKINELANGPKPKPGGKKQANPEDGREKTEDELATYAVGNPLGLQFKGASLGGQLFATALSVFDMEISPYANEAAKEALESKQPTGHLHTPWAGMSGPKPDK